MSEMLRPEFGESLRANLNGERSSHPEKTPASPSAERIREVLWELGVAEAVRSWQAMTPERVAQKLHSLKDWIQHECQDQELLRVLAEGISEQLPLSLQAGNLEARKTFKESVVSERPESTDWKQRIGPARYQLLHVLRLGSLTLLTPFSEVQKIAPPDDIPTQDLYQAMQEAGQELLPGGNVANLAAARLEQVAGTAE